MTGHPDRTRSVMLFVVYAVMLLYPAFMFIQREVRSQYLAVLLLMAIYGFVTKKIRPTHYALHRSDYLVLFSFALITIIAWVSYAHFGFQDYAKQRVEKYTWFLLSIPVYYLFLYTKPRLEIIWLGVVIGCFVAFGRALLEEFSLVDPIAWKEVKDRAHGSMHPIRFGDLSLLMGCIALNGAINLPKLKPLIRLIGIVGFFSGLGASILSGSRGGWIALPVLLGVILWFKLRQEKSRKGFVIFSAIFLGLVSFVMSSDVVQQRMYDAMQEVKLYVEENQKWSPVGERIEMYKTALNAFIVHPVFGVGVGGYHPYSIEYSREYNKLNKRKLPRGVTRWKNPHNEFLLHAATRGIVGLSALIFMMAIISLRGLLGGNVGVKEASRFSSVNLILLGVGFSIFGLTIALFEHKDFLLFFLIYVMVSLASLMDPTGEQ